MKIGESPVNIGTALRLSRTFRRERQWRVAGALHITDRTLGDYEAGRREPPPEVIEKAARLFGPDPWLLAALREHPVVRAWLHLTGAERRPA